MPGPTTTVLGIDPGSRKVGWGLVSSTDGRLRCLASGALRLDPRQPLPQRLGQLLGELQALFERHPCEALAIEAAFVRDNPQTALVLGQARGLPIAIAAARGLPVHEYPPALVKRRLVGTGRAEKGQMREMVRVILGLPELPGEDEADALAVAVTHLREAAWDVAVASPAPALHAALAVAPPPTPARALYLSLVQAAGDKPRRSR